MRSDPVVWCPRKNETFFGAPEMDGVVTLIAAFFCIALPKKNVFVQLLIHTQIDIA